MKFKRLPLFSSLVLPVLLLGLSLGNNACGPMPDGDENPYDLGIQDPAEQQNSIINGEACGPETMSTAVAILIDADITMFGRTGTMRSAICTGTLIAPDVVIAAAHCFDPDALTMGYGTVDRARYGISFTADLSYMSDGQEDWPEDAVEGVKWYGHEDFQMDAFNQGVAGPGDFKDIGILFLAEPVTTVEPELLISANEVDQLRQDAAVKIAGWGQQTQTAANQTPPPGTVGIKMCADTTINELGNWEMQIGGDSTTSRKCHGDSGGPTYLDIETPHARKRRLIGITSHAYDDSDCAKGGVDTRVDVWLSWIDTQMKNACEDGTRSWCEVTGILPVDYFDPPPVDPNADPDQGKEKSGCGCSAHNSDVQMPVWLLFGLAALYLRRRQNGVLS